MYHLRFSWSKPLALLLQKPTTTIYTDVVLNYHLLMNKNTRRKIGAGVLDFYLIFTIISLLILSLLSIAKFQFNYIIAILIVIVSVAVSVFYHKNASKWKMNSIGELSYGISKVDSSIFLEKYNFQRILNIIGSYLVLIPISKILEFQLEQNLNPRHLTILFFLVILVTYSLYNYHKFGGIKNLVLIIGITVIINWSNNKTFNIGFNWSSIPFFTWIIILINTQFNTSSKTNDTI